MAPIKTESGPQLQIPMTSKRTEIRIEPTEEPKKANSAIAKVPINVPL